jgi:GNAT superfamily N-acetyltransferase
MTPSFAPRQTRSCTFDKKMSAPGKRRPATGPARDTEVDVNAHAVKARLKAILPLRALFLQEMHTQIRYDACHERGWTDSYLLKLDDLDVGYGAIKGQERADRDTIFEFYVAPPFRTSSSRLCRALIEAARTRYIECQSNDPLLSPMLYEFARGIRTDTVLFEDHTTTHHQIPGAIVRPRRRGDRIFEHTGEPIGDYVLEVDGEIVATGGFMLHYNVPFADLYMEVRSDRRRRGYASFLLQEVKKACYLAGRVPAARCGLGNEASRAALIKAGLRVSGFMLLGDIAAAPELEPSSGGGARRQ